MMVFRRPRYILFAGSDYYPLGGMDDKKFSFEAIDGAAAVAEAQRYVSGHDEIDWWQLAWVGKSGPQVVEQSRR